ncbi:hypothetical protein RUM43_006802 [Polyplax serrata]|uniref:Uncharacterized protein n=1 Tax=Polyplax serrata TaxID=468196 RepID=A0AAN8S541_POLSC
MPRCGWIKLPEDDSGTLNFEGDPISCIGNFKISNQIIFLLLRFLNLGFVTRWEGSPDAMPSNSEENGCPDPSENYQLTVESDDDDENSCKGISIISKALRKSSKDNGTYIGPDSPFLKASVDHSEQDQR